MRENVEVLKGNKESGEQVNKSVEIERKSKNKSSGEQIDQDIGESRNKSSIFFLLKRRTNEQTDGDKEENPKTYLSVNKSIEIERKIHERFRQWCFKELVMAELGREGFRERGDWYGIGRMVLSGRVELSRIETNKLLKAKFKKPMLSGVDKLGFHGHTRHLPRFTFKYATCKP
ncbi:hypothetical protein OSB04_007468 [Centaurea solstitialis]|uniref:Uncharacterized protein n=1 Tax=Centaurea solstitialis TaxID=347529 RepID=A0AA38TSI1_9ASTR|nr:hypothetical protein OSB04_007468 [Centaurea solstitialis]